jgi:hypothetical protein
MVLNNLTQQEAQLLDTFMLIVMVMVNTYNSHWLKYRNDKLIPSQNIRESFEF